VVLGKTLILKFKLNFMEVGFLLFHYFLVDLLQIFFTFLFFPLKKAHLESMRDFCFFLADDGLNPRKRKLFAEKLSVKSLGD